MKYVVVTFRFIGATFFKSPRYDERIEFLCAIAIPAKYRLSSVGKAAGLPG